MYNATNMICLSDKDAGCYEIISSDEVWSQLMTDVLELPQRLIDKIVQYSLLFSQQQHVRSSCRARQYRDSFHQLLCGYLVPPRSSYLEELIGTLDLDILRGEPCRDARIVEHIVKLFFT